MSHVVSFKSFLQHKLLGTSVNYSKRVQRLGVLIHVLSNKNDVPPVHHTTVRIESTLINVPLALCTQKHVRRATYLGTESNYCCKSVAELYLAKAYTLVTNIQL